MGWPKGKPRGPRKSKAEAPQEMQAPAEQVRAEPPKTTAIRQPVRSIDPVHEPIREGAVQVRGREGEVLTRKRTQSSDIFHIPDDIIPAGWNYQWNTVEVYGQQQVAMQLAMHENGWRPVPAGRHPGRFMPVGTSPNADIVRDGMRLEERPDELTREARAEERAKANKQMRDQQEQLGLSQKLPDGFSRDNRKLRAMERQQTSRTYAPAPDIARPQLEIDPNG